MNYRKVDPLTVEERSAHMSKVRSRGNKSTELAVEELLEEAEIEGWVKHAKEVPGNPDFYFPERRLAVFVHGCFWHGCPHCERNIPKTRTDFWRKKIEQNKWRDRRVRRRLWRNNYHVMRIWEHTVRSETWLRRLRTMLQRIGVEGQGDAAGPRHS